LEENVADEYIENENPETRETPDNQEYESTEERGGERVRASRGPMIPGRGGKVFFKKKICKFCAPKKSKSDYKPLKADYKAPEVLRRFTTDRGKILPRRITGTCAKHQRALTVEIKKARRLALLPFVEK
jgi:small subunit ribosomal protein S18